MAQIMLCAWFVRNLDMAALFGLIALAITSCAKNDMSKGRKDHDPVAEKLSAVEMSEPLTVTSDLESCDQSAIVAGLDKAINPSAKHASTLWEACQSSYACSPITKDLLLSSFQTGKNFYLGYVDFKKLDVPKIGDQAKAVFLGKTSSIYLDLSLGTPRETCGILLHELVHLLDPVAREGEESLRTEYRSYWHQTAFEDELLKLEGPLGDDLRAHAAAVAASVPGGQHDGSQIRPIPYHTRESLLRAIADTYGFQIDTEILKRYPRLPREPKLDR